ncbi:MAG TPA: hypothetical protein VGG25_09120 [Streptosporangiaceae bacterium]|jgi:putative ABC transport system permease protein
MTLTAGLAPPPPSPPPSPLRGWRLLTRLATGEAGPGPVWALAAAALLTAFLATAAPRETAQSAQVALNGAIAGLNGGETGVTVTGQWLAERNNASHEVTPAGLADYGRTLAGLLKPPLRSPTARQWSEFATNSAQVTNAPKKAVLALSPAMEVVYRSGLAAHSRLVSGRLPGGAITGPVTTVQVALTVVTAQTLGLHTGSVVDLGPALRLAVTGVIRPVGVSTPYWAIDPLPTVPGKEGGFSDQHYVSGALAGPAATTAIQNSVAGQFVRGTWFLPIGLRGVTPATLPRLLGSVSALSSISLPLQVTRKVTLGAPPALNSQLSSSLNPFLAQQQAADAIDALIVAGLLAAALILLVVCGRLAADAYAPELTLLRARGGSNRQAARRVAGRALLIAGPAAAAGAVLAIFLLPGGGSALPWASWAAVGLVAVGAPAALAAWQHRRVRLPGSQRAEQAARRSPRRAVAEITIIVLAAGALAVLRLRGSPGHANAFTSISPVLAALAASLLAARIYPLPVRGLLSVAAGRPGPVGFVGLARAARARVGGVLPALALVLALTVMAFSAMVGASVMGGQNDAAWQRTGADAAITAPGAGVIGTRAERAVALAGGIRQETAVYTATASGPFSAELTVPGGQAHQTGLAVVRPAQYARLAAATPWPGFPAGLLRHRVSGRVPVLISAPVAAALGTSHGPASMELDGSVIKVTLAAVTGPTPADPAAPAGGVFTVVPQWAAGGLPSILGPDELLANGPGTDTAAFRAAAARAVPGGSLALRQRAYQAMRDAPAQAAAERIVTLGSWAAAALSVVAILLGLAASAADRAALARRMSALGMPVRQSFGLALTETLPLLAVGVLGMLVAAAGLGELMGPALNLTVFAPGIGAVPVHPQVSALLLPAAGAVVVALAIVGAQAALGTRQDAATRLRTEEAG